MHCPFLRQPALRGGAVALLLVAARPALAQDAAPSPRLVLTLVEALEYARDHYPAIRAASEQVNVSSAQVRVARSAFRPHLDAVWQTNRATVNNVTGPLLPQGILAPISGPPVPSASAGSAWGTAAGGLFSWEVLDMGLRGATVDQATAGLTRARADEALTRLEAQAAVGAAFLATAAAEQALSAADADVTRRETIARTVQVLADSQLRPGADASRASAELAAARTRAIQARQAAELSRHALARLLGTTSEVAIDAARLLAPPLELEGTEPGPVQPPASSTPGHPIVAASRAALEEARAHERLVARADRPRVLLQSSVSARGSGASLDGRLLGGSHGLLFDRANWAAGVQVIFPNLLDSAARDANRAAAAAETRLQGAHAEDVLLDLTARRRGADSLLRSARSIALNTPLQVAAAREGEAQARARYEAGLAALVEVADAQQLLAAAEHDHAAATVSIWSALLARAVADGDLTPFLDRLRAAGVD